MVVEAFKFGVKEIERTFGENILVSKVTEVEKVIESLSETRGHKAFKRIEKYLQGLSTWSNGSEMIHTFISALESLLVHCLKFCPCLNLRRPGKRGASAML